MADAVASSVKKRCIICDLILEKRSNINLVCSTGEFNPLYVIRSLKFEVRRFSTHICKRCKGKLKHLKNLHEQVSRTENEIQKMYEESSEGEEATESGKKRLSLVGVDQLGPPNSSVAALAEKRIRIADDVNVVDPLSLSTTKTETLENIRPTDIHGVVDTATRKYKKI